MKAERIESKVRLDEPLHQALRRIEYQRDIARQQLIVEALEAYLVRDEGPKPDPPQPDPNITPQSDSELRLVAKLLRILRDKHTLPRDVAVIEGFFDNYLRQSTQSSANKRA